MLGLVGMGCRGRARRGMDAERIGEAVMERWGAVMTGGDWTG